MNLKTYSVQKGAGNHKDNVLIRTAHNFTIPQLVRLINSEHNYSLPPNISNNTTKSVPARFLFQNTKDFYNFHETDSSSDVQSDKSWEVESDEENGLIDVDVTTIDDDDANDSKSLYDSTKAQSLMEECERHVNFARLNKDDGDNGLGTWEDRIVKTGWTKKQKSIFRRTLKILHDDHLARLAYSGNAAEPLFRRLAIDKTARDFRCLLTEFGWDRKLSTQLHSFLVDNLSLNYLSAYLDVLQTLKAKIPNLIDQMIVYSTTKNDIGTLQEIREKQDCTTNSNNENNIIKTEGGEVRHPSSKKIQLNIDALNLLLKRQWDPFSPTIKATKYKKIDGNPVFVIVPSGRGNNIICQSRQKSLLSLLNGIGKVVSVSLNSSTRKLNIHQFCERMLNTTKSKIAEVVHSFPNKDIYLLGWGTGGIVASTILSQSFSQEQDKTVFDAIAGVICLAFPLYGIFGSRSEFDDPLYNLKHPILFIIGDRATNVNVTELEIFRKKLKCENCLSVICHSDNFLRLSNYHQKQLKVTQSFVDKCIVDEISWFATNLPYVTKKKKSTIIVQEKSSYSSSILEEGEIKVTPTPITLPSNNNNISTTTTNVTASYTTTTTTTPVPTITNSSTTSTSTIIRSSIPTITISSTSPCKASVPLTTTINSNGLRKVIYYRPTIIAQNGSMKTISSPYPIATSKFIQHSTLGKRKIQDLVSNSHTTVIQSRAVNSPLIRPLPSKVSKDFKPTLGPCILRHNVSQDLKVKSIKSASILSRKSLPSN